MENSMNNHEEKIFKELLRQLEDKDTNTIRDNGELRDALHMLHDAKHALRSRHPIPSDVERELLHTTSRIHGYNETKAHIVREKKSYKPLISGLLGGFGIGIAATVIIMFSLGFFTREQAYPTINEPILLYSAVAVTPSENVDNTLIPAPDNDYASNKATDNKNISSQSDDACGVLDMRLYAASDIEECTITTTVGKTRDIILADGTSVLLGQESTLRFPSRFSGDSRIVNLDGEAYFDVAKDAEHPFIVMSKGYSTTALGTEFDVRAYQQSDLRVSLIDGSVQVENLADQQSVILNAGEDVTSVDGKFVVSSVDMKAFKYWREGYFYFNDVPLADMMVELGRWHNVNVVLNSRALMSYRLHFVTSRSEDIQNIVERLNKFSYLDVKYDDGKITIDERHTQ